MKCSTNRCRSSVIDDLDRGLSEFMQGVIGGNVVTSEDPRISFVESNDRYFVECDLPGVTLDNITLQLEENILSIAGKRDGGESGENAKVIVNERSRSEFARQVRLPKDVDQSSVDAELKNGVLKITVLKRPEVLPMKIEIKRA